jgi:hypothetical protein
MSKLLTLRNREDKGDVHSGFEARLARTLKALSPSYFDGFCLFSWVLVLRAQASSKKLRLGSKHEIAPAAAIMAIV